MLSYHDRDRRKIWFDVFEIWFSDGRVGTSANSVHSFSTGKLKRKILMNIPMKDIPRYFIKHWRDDFDELLVEPEARKVLSVFLRNEFKKMMAWGKRYEGVMGQL